jgi:phage/plasmid-associated DNA primase
MKGEGKGGQTSPNIQTDISPHEINAPMPSISVTESGATLKYGGTSAEIGLDDFQLAAEGTVTPALAAIGERMGLRETEIIRAATSAAAPTGGDYFPGPIRIVEALQTKYRFRTIPEIGTDREPIYYFNGQIYERAEEKIKEESHKEYVRQWRDMIRRTTDKDLKARLEHALNRGPSANEINEVLAMVRRTTFTYDEMNPGSHIPFKNGLLNLNTRKLEPFSSDLFYTYQIDANLLNRYVTLKDAPKFSYLLNTAFYQRDVPMVLAYSAYSFHPGLPQHKVLFVLGRQRIGKGTLARVLQGLMPKGSGSISLARLLTSERFAFTGIEGKNLLIDSETKRKFRRGTVLEWSAFCNLFGEDVLSVEPKGHEAHDYVSRAKGIFLGNLPFIPVDSPPAIARILLVVTRDEPPKKVIPDLDKKILEGERDQIATLLMQVLFRLIDRDFIFPGQMTDDQTAQILEKLADPVENFIEEMTEYDRDGLVPVKKASAAFSEWCKRKGIPVISDRTFTTKFGKTYPKKRIGTHGKGGYGFISCTLLEEEQGGGSETPDLSRTQPDFTESPKNGLSGNIGTGFSETYTEPPAIEGEVREYNKEYTAHYLEPKPETSTSPENKAPRETQLGSRCFRGHQSTPPENSSKTHRNPEKSNFQSEFSPITGDEGDALVGELLKEGINVNPKDTGVSLDRKSYKIAIPTPRDPVKLTGLKEKMAALGFKPMNTGAYGTLFFVRPFKEGGSS